jgi:hypothetical protein
MVGCVTLTRILTLTLTLTLTVTLTRRPRELQEHNGGGVRRVYSCEGVVAIVSVVAIVRMWWQL